MAKKTNKSSAQQIIKDRSKLEWLLIALLLIFIWLLLASRFGWWPWDGDNAKLGSAFYSSSQEQAADKSSSSGNNGSASGSGGSSTSDNNDDSDGSGSGGSGGGSGGGGSSSSTSSILTFAAGVDKGDTKQKVSGRSNGLNERCTVIVNNTSAGKQEVCTYTEGNKVVTVTYLNDRVISASRSGF